MIASLVELALAAQIPAHAAVAGQVAPPPVLECGVRLDLHNQDGSTRVIATGSLENRPKCRVSSSPGPG
jgi:hypothetical protein